MLVFKNITLILTLIYAGYTDYRKRIIPDKVHVIIMLLSLFGNFNPFSSIIGLLLLPIPFIVPVFFHEDSVGGGDIKIIGAIGFYLGLGKGIIAVIVGLIIAVFFSLLILKKDRNDSFPLGPYIAIGSIVALFI